MSPGLIDAVAPGSWAQQAGVRPGDVLLSINDQAPRDVIDVRIAAAEPHVALEVQRAGEILTLAGPRRYDQDLGLSFAEPLFDGIRRCNNHCEFCFVTQMPPGLRRSLYIKDDDYRTSFLFGSYITLTNLVEDDWQRIAAQHLSPLYVSVHATDPALRRWVLRNPNAPAIVPQLQRLAGLGIEMHTQIVLTPGLNDGPHLERSIADLAALSPALRSISVVPVGVTRFHRGGCRVQTDEEVATVVDQVTAWQDQLRERLGVGLVYLSDEWYLRLGQEVPGMAAYDGLALTENGVGLVRHFLDAHPAQPAGALWVTGTLFAPLLESVIGEERVVPIKNHFFGETVTVAGLLTGQDVVDQLKARDVRGPVRLPPAMFGGPQGQTLDEMTRQDIAQRAGIEVLNHPKEG